MSKIPITERWKLPINNSNYPKNDTKYKTEECDNSINRRPCKFQQRGKCLFWHYDYERDYWNYVRKTAKGTGDQPAEIDKEIKRQNLLAQGKLAVGSERPKKEEKERGTSPFEYGLGGRKKRKSLFKKKITKKRRRKRRTKKRKSRKRRRTKRKKK